MSTAPALPPAPDPRLLDLLADRAVGPLSADDCAELDKLADLFPDFDTDSFDRTAAALAVGLTSSSLTAPPEALQRSLRAAGAAWAAAHQADSLAAQPPQPLRADFHTAPAVRANRLSAAAWTGWLAAAAAIMLAVAGWWGRTERAASPAQRLAALAGSGAPVIEVAWSSGPTASEFGGPAGRVVWCPDRQEGYMVFRNLRPNDPAIEQYQLWIFDATRDDRYPIDGGVFDVTTSGEVVVPIRAAVPVRDAAMFAITVERPGGVVVSDRSRLPALAVVKSAG